MEENIQFEDDDEEIDDDAYLSETDSINLQFSFESPNLQARPQAKTPPMLSTSAPSQNSSFAGLTSSGEEKNEKKRAKSTISVPPSWSSYYQRRTNVEPTSQFEKKKNVLSEIPESSPILPELNLTTSDPSPEIEVFYTHINFLKCVKNIYRYPVTA